MNEVLSYIRERISLKPEKTRRWTVRGSNLAAGLPNLVYCCPACGTMESMKAEGDILGCRFCSRSWIVDTTNRLRDQQDGTTLTVAQAAQRAREALGVHWVQDLPRFEAEGVIMESEPLSLLDQTGDEPVEIGKGRLRLSPDGVALVDAAVKWSLPLADLRAVSIEVTRGLRFMTSNQIFEPLMPRESVIKWRDAMVHWMAR